MTSHRAVPADAIEAFRRGSVDVLVCTDLAAEGLNLQRAGVVVHYDLPWNPVRLDQRNGRALRIGQTRDTVRAIYFLPLREGRRTQVVSTLAHKNRTRKRLLGRAEPALSGRERETASRLALPQRLARSSPAVALMVALRRRGIDLPPDIARRHRAGIERLLAEMSREYLDDARVTDLLSLLRRERIIAIGDTRGSADCR
jgi:superfamily II DNA/RNA helicase